MSRRVSSIPSSATTRRTLMIGSVSFLNAKPLIWGLDQSPGLTLSLDVPSRLIEGMREQRYDVALLPVIDYQRLGGLCIVPSGGIGCDGPTLTVRLFSRRPIEQTRVLACDPDSHTSVALARIILADRYQLRPTLIDLREATGADGEARLLIGDKVVAEEPAGFAHQLDLGEAWKEMTGLPFVFAVWIAREGVDLFDVPARLEQARCEGLLNVRQIVARHAAERGWPAELALQYLTEYLKFEIGPAQLEAIRLFHRNAAEHGIIPNPPMPLRLYS